MYKRLYSDGAVQLSRDFSVQVLQGMCVGGGTVVNNGVCFDPPDEALMTWSRPPFASGLTAGALRPALDDVRRLLQVDSLTHVRRNPAGRLLSGPAERLRERGAVERHGSVDANIAGGCYGCGYCNIGCAYGKKLSVLDWVLPRAQARHPGRLQIVSECQATRILRSGSRATGVRCRLGDGRKITVRARRALVVAAGAIHSSRLLLRSRIGGGQVGRGFGANLASFMTAEFDSRLDAFDSLQLGDYIQPPRGAGYVIESIFNPVMTQSLLMPGWFEDHERNMSRYAHMTCAGVLLGTGRGNRVRRFADLLTSSEFDLTLTRGELERLVIGLKQAGSLLLEAGAERVMPATFHLVEASRPDELSRLDEVVRDSSDISLTTAHPQGGNAVSSDPRYGVVGPDLGVHGCDNLYVCDASVFPTPIGVNPQLTVMAVARLAAERLALS
jgi:choline dehydrogenase-like flavoprotein